MTGQEPIIGMDVHLRPDAPQPEPPAGRIQFGHAIYELQHPARQSQRRRERQSRETWSEAPREVARAKRFELTFVVPFNGRHRQQVSPVGGTLPRHMASVQGRLYDALAPHQFRGSEEPGAPLSHSQEQFSIDRSFEPEPEQVSLTLAEKVVDVNVVPDDGSRLRQVIVERHHRVQ